jgi:hypothetical protein
MQVHVLRSTRMHDRLPLADSAICANTFVILSGLVRIQFSCDIENRGDIDCASVVIEYYVEHIAQLHITNEPSSLWH